MSGERPNDIVNPWKRLSQVNPQVENGYRSIANDVYMWLVKFPFSRAELKIVLFIIGQTWGWQRKAVNLEVQHIMTATGLGERTVQAGIKSLKEKRVIYYEPSAVRVQRGSPINRFLFNKHYDTWLEKGCKNLHDAKKGAETCKKGCRNLRPHNYIKEISKKKKQGEPMVPDDRIESIVKFFIEQTFQLRGFKPVTTSKDISTLKDKLKMLSIESIKSCIVFFIKDKKADNVGITLSIALSAHSINSWKQSISLSQEQLDELKDEYKLLRTGQRDNLQEIMNQAAQEREQIGHVHTESDFYGHLFDMLCQKGQRIVEIMKMVDEYRRSKIND